MEADPKLSEIETTSKLAKIQPIQGRYRPRLTMATAVAPAAK
jgi:hypothetical protein